MLRKLTTGLPIGIPMGKAPVQNALFSNLYILALSLVQNNSFLHRGFSPVFWTSNPPKHQIKNNPTFEPAINFLVTNR